jgi:hypothetical protein
MDYIQMHNAQLMQEMAKLRVAIIRKNAQLVDWLAEHVGSINSNLFIDAQRSRCNKDVLMSLQKQVYFIKFIALAYL